MRVQITNTEAIGTIVVVVEDTTEDGWGKEHARTVREERIGPGETKTFDVENRWKRHEMTRLVITDPLSP